MSEAPEDLRTQILQEIRHQDEKISGEEMELLVRKWIFEDMLKERRSAEEEEGELHTVIAGDGVAQKAVAGFRISETEDDLFLADVDGTDDTVVAGGSLSRKAIAGSQSTESPSVEEKCRREGKGTDETFCRWEWSKFRNGE